MIQPTNMQYPQQGGANAVSINIYNPQAYGSTGAVNPGQCAPYQYTNSLYQMPQASAYAPAASAQPAYMPPYVMQAPMPQQQFVAPAPQAMPESVIAPQVAVAPMVEQTQNNATQVAAQEAAPVEIVEPQQVTQTPRD